MRYRVIAKFDNETRIYENKMTREEAKQKLLKNNSTFRGVEIAVYFIDALEALGLIKFEETKSKSIDECLIPNFGSYAGVEAVKKALDENGYKIVRKS